MVVSELRGEKIDIIPFNDEPARFVAKALSPARVREVLVDDEAKQATVIVPDDQLSLAIGKDGLNARLAARLTGWRVDIRSETEFAEEEAEMGYQEEEVSGRCAAILANGKRCPNASLPGSRYCGLPAHQALEGTGTDYLVPPEGEGEGDAADAESSQNGDLPVEDLVEAAVEEAPVQDVVVEDAIAEEAPVEEAPVATADQPIDEEPAAEGDPVPEDEPADPEEEPASDPDDPDLGEEPESGDDDDEDEDEDDTSDDTSSDDTSSDEGAEES
jgi:transcription termination/antitermination protein NusA